MDVNFQVIIPVANPVKFTQENVNDDERANFDQKRYFNSINATTQQRRFPQPLESTDPLRVQYYSNYPRQKLEVVNCDGVVFQVYTPAVAIQYRNKKYGSDAKFSSINDKLFIYFDTGTEYSDEDFLVAGDTVALLGRLPNINAVSGDLVRYKIGASFEATVIDSIAWSPSLSAQGYLTTTDITLMTPVDGLVEITYDEKESNLYAQAVNLLPLLEGEYFLRLSFGVATYTISFVTEPLQVKIKHPKTLAIEYRHNGTFEEEDIWSYIYLSNWTNVIRMPTDFYEIDVAGEVDLDVNDNGVPRMLRAVPFRQISFKAHNIPGWMVDKLSVIFSHDSKKVNGYYWENENLGEFNIIARVDLGIFEIKLRQVNDRTNFITEFVDSVTAEFVPGSFEDLDFEGEVVTSEFISNTLSVFSFLSLPDWIITDHPTFVNGDIVEFTIDENETAFQRTIVLTAVTDDFNGLTASISFNQLYDDSVPPPPEFLEVSSNDVTLGYALGSNEQISVNASGDYTISNVGVSSFDAVKENGILNVRISVQSFNAGPGDRVGVIRLTLNSNPSIFQDVDVTQTAQVLDMLSLSPTGAIFPPASWSELVDVSVVPGTSWQALSSEPSWCIVDTSIHTGSVVGFSVFVQGREDFVEPRFAQVNFINTANGGDILTYTVEQT